MISRFAFFSNRLPILALVVTILAATAGPSSAGLSNGRFICAARNDGVIDFYSMDNGHTLVKSIRAFSAGAVNIRGIVAVKATQRLYVSYNDSSEGHVVCVDLNTDAVIWNKILHFAVDRGDVTPDGRILYMPTGEGDPNSPYELVVDAITGNVLSQIPMPTRSHDTFCTFDGTRVYMEVKSNDPYVRVVSTQTNTVTSKIGPFDDVVMPFAVKHDNSLLIANVVGVYGFQYADPATGRVLGTAQFTGTSFRDAPDLLRAHGIGMTPDEREAWVVDRGTGNNYVHVFDLTSLPPRQTHLVTVGSDDPRWITFSIDGKYCYVRCNKDPGNKTEVVDTATYKRIGTIGTSEEVVLEVDFANGAVTAVGSQFGSGRGQSGSPSPTPTPVPTATPSPTPIPTATPKPTPTPQPSATPIPPTAQTQVTSFTLINADTARPVRGYEVINNGAVIDATRLPTSHLNVRANTNPGVVGSVRFGYDGDLNAMMQNHVPYALFSDTYGDYHSGRLTLGNHTLIATPFTRPYGSGSSGNSLRISFKVVSGTTSN